MKQQKVNLQTKWSCYSIYIMLVSSIDPLFVCSSVCHKIEILITWPIWVGLERQIYLQNQGDMLVMTMMSVHVHPIKHTCQHACTLFSGMLRPISQPNWVGSKRQRYLQNWGDMPVMTLMSVHVHASMHACQYNIICISTASRNISSL